MKKLILTFWILIMVVWPGSLNPAENQKIIFSGVYSVDYEPTDADSAWLYIAYYETFIDSVLVSAESEGWGGWYRYKHECTNDSAWGWSGLWVYADNSEGTHANELAVVATARDSSYALEVSITAVRDSMDEAAQIADTAGIALDVFAEFTDGSNEDQFKATGFSTHSQVDSLKDSVEALSLNVPSQAQVDSLFDTLHVLMHTSDTNAAWSVTESDTNNFEVEDFMDSIRALMADSNTARYSKRADYQSSGDTNQIQGATDTDLDSVLQAIADANKPNFQSDGDTNQVQGSTDTDLDSVLQSIADANKPNFQSDGDTNTNPFDNANDKVTLVDSSADGIHDAEIAALDGLDSANVIHQKLFFQGLSDSSSSGLTDTELRTALGDSLYNERMDSLLTVLVEVKGYSLDLAYYWGACDGCYYRLFPEGGLADKDSAIIIDPAQGADSLVAKVIYKHGTDVEIVDTVYFYRDEPW